MTAIRHEGRADKPTMAKAKQLWLRDNLGSAALCGLTWEKHTSASTREKYIQQATAHPQRNKEE